MALGMVMLTWPNLCDLASQAPSRHVGEAAPRGLSSARAAQQEHDREEVAWDENVKIALLLI